MILLSIFEKIYFKPEGPCYQGSNLGQWTGQYWSYNINLLTSAGSDGEPVIRGTMQPGSGPFPWAGQYGSYNITLLTLHD